MQKESNIEDIYDNNSYCKSKEILNHHSYKQKEAAKDLKTSILNRALCFISKGFYNRAIKDSLRVLELDSHNDKAKSIICLSYIEMNDIKSAEKYLPLNNSLHVVYEKKMNELIEYKSKYVSYDNYLYFIKTLYNYDAYFPKIDIKFMNNGHRGVISKSIINKNEVIMSIPKECLISLDLAQLTTFGQEISKFMYTELKSPKHCLLATFLLTEETNPRWKFYLDMMPQDVSNFPIYYGQREYELLKGTSFVNQLEEKKKEIHKDYETLIRLLPSYKQFSFDEFCKARMLISSRIFGIKMNNKKTDILAPYADLLNHKRPNQTHWYYDEMTKAFAILAMTDIPQGVELYDSYGIKGNSRFLMHYGFTLEKNEANEYPLKVSLESTVPYYSEKELCIKNSYCCTKTFTISVNTFTNQVLDMFSFIRFIVFKGNMQELSSLINQGISQGQIQSVLLPINNNSYIQSFYSINPISVENEQDALIHLRELCINELKGYSTTIEQDMNMLSNDSLKLSFNERNCIIIRLSEKKVLQFYIEMCESALKLFQLNEKELIQAIITNEEYEKIEKYIQDVIWVLLKKNKKEIKSNNTSIL